jgi:ABC-type spermidine/putrescine transport system permease subunit II
LIWRLTPWLGRRPGRAIALPAWLDGLLDQVMPVLARVLIGIALVLLLLPLVLVLVQSVNDVPQATVAVFKGFTLKWYRQLFEGGLYLDSIWTSLELALSTSLVTVLLSAAAAFAIVRFNFFGKKALEFFWMFPLSLPQVAVGVGMLRLLQLFTLLPPFAGLLLVHVMVTMPFCIGLLRASVEQLDRAQEDAAASLGAGPLRRIVHVILPGLAPGLAAAAIVAILLSFEEVTITSFLTTARMTTLPVRIYAEATYSLEPTVFAVSALMIALTIGAMLVLGRLVRLDRVFSR